MVPLIVMSDGTHLSNIPCNKKESPVFRTIGNLFSNLRRVPSTHSIVMFALLAIPIMKRIISHKWLDEQRPTNQEVLNEVLWQGFQPLTFKHNPSAESGYYNFLCAHGNFRHCKPA
jgi:hypothetical protein